MTYTHECNNYVVKIVIMVISAYFTLFPEKRTLKGKFSSGIEGALASTLNHDFN